MTDPEATPPNNPSNKQTDESPHTDSTDGPNTPDASDSNEPPPRAFAQGTGILLQVVGVTLFLTTCCVCSSAWIWDPIYTSGEIEKQVTEEQKQPIPTLATMFDEPGNAGFSLMVVFSTVGGLAMAVFGLGLQADKLKASLGAVITVILWLVVLIIAGVCLWIGDGSIVARLWHFLMFVIACVLLGFTIAALKQIKNSPPPPGMDILPADWEPPARRH